MSYVTKLTIDSSKIAADLTDFPVYVDLADMNAKFWSTVANGGGDIRVFKSDGTTELPREVVSCNRIQYVGGISRQGAGSSSYNVSLTSLSGGIDTQPQEGDIVIVTSGGSSNGADYNAGVTTSGYTELYEEYAADTRDVNMASSYKVMGATPDTSVDVTGSNGSLETDVCVIQVWRGVDTTTPIDVTSQSTSGSNSSTVNSPSITPITANSVVISTGIVVGAQTPTVQISDISGYENIITVNGDYGGAAGAGIASKLWSGSGAEDPPAWTGNTASGVAANAEGTIVLRPAENGSGELHFKYTGTLSSSSDTEVQIHADGVSSDYATTDTYGAENVWSDYTAVYHLSSLTDDSTGNSNTLTNLNSVGTTASKIGDGADFGTANTNKTLTRTSNLGLTNTSAFTFSSWFKMETEISTGTQTVLSKTVGGSSWNQSNFEYDYNGGSRRVRFSMNSGGGNREVTDSVTLGTANYNQMVGTYSGGTSGTFTLYRDGSAKGTAIAALSGTTESDRFSIGSFQNIGRYLSAVVDEVRIRNTVLSADWITTEYNNQNSPSTFYTAASTSPQNGLLLFFNP